jgi:peptide chain release factor 1
MSQPHRIILPEGRELPLSLDQAKAKLEEVESRYEEIEAQINDPAFSSDYQLYMQAAKSKNEIEPVVLKYKHYKRILQDIPEA